MENIAYNFDKITLKIHFHDLEVFHILILQDGRLSSSSDDGKIIIYNKINYQPDLIISEHKNDTISYHIQLTNGNIVTCSYDKTIKIIKLKGRREYELLQTIKDHTDNVLKVLEYKENNIISCSYDQTMKIILLKNGKYICSQSIVINPTSKDDSNLLYIKNFSEILTSSNVNSYIRFWNIENINDIKLISNINNIPCNIWPNSMTILGEKLIIGTELNGIFLVNINNHQLICNIGNEISYICTVISLLNGNILIGGRDDVGQSIIECKIENNSLIKIKSKNTKHLENITDIIALKNGSFITCSMDEYIKFFSK